MIGGPGGNEGGATMSDVVIYVPKSHWVLYVLVHGVRVMWDFPQLVRYICVYVLFALERGGILRVDEGWGTRYTRKPERGLGSCATRRLLAGASHRHCCALSR